jgi:predicted MPP superfamily phosphohydrolase
MPGAEHGQATGGKMGSEATSGLHEKYSVNASGSSRKCAHGDFHGWLKDVSTRSALTVKMLFVADLHYALKQFDWLMTNASRFDVVVIGGDLLDLGSALEIDVQIVVVEKYLGWLREQARLLVSSGNHDGDHRLATNESI